MDFLPIFMNVKDRPCLVVGGGEVAARKVELLRQAGARVRIVAPQLGDALTPAVDEGRFEYRCGQFRTADLDGCVLVIAATNRSDVNANVAVLARARSLPVNVVDTPDECSFIVPSIIDRSPVMVAVSSGGASPVLARLLRARLETLIPASYGCLAALVQGFRQRVKRVFKDTQQRRIFWEKVLQGPVAEMMFSGQDEAARRALERSLVAGADSVKAEGEVYLVGAGPGDPDLLTFRALRLLQQADVIVYDALVTQPILDLARRDADRIYVGKRKNCHTLPQQGINQLLVDLAKCGKRVVRLKGGDPFIFGRGGEEIDTLMAEGIPFQVVPGITAAAGCSSYSGIPLTHRDYAQSVVFATGHLKDGSVNLNWSALAQPHQTVVFYMGLTGLSVICSELIRHGLPANTPIALVEQGTTHAQRVHIGTLANMPSMVTTIEIQPPTLIIVGEVVKLHEKLKWFRPLEAAINATVACDVA